MTTTTTKQYAHVALVNCKKMPALVISDFRQIFMPVIPRTTTRAPAPGVRHRKCESDSATTPQCHTSIEGLAVFLYSYFHVHKREQKTQS